jgi:2-methylisocitrate lyase-like PEP mutase family enzyme
MSTQAEKALAFRALHTRDRAFIIPNPWDAGTARLLAHLGFEALATTSAGYAFSVGQHDNTVSRDAMMTHLSAIAAATDLPVSADLGNCFGDMPEEVAETIRLAAVAGVVGGSVEDATGRPNSTSDGPIYCFEHAVARVQAAAEAAHALPFPFTLTARAENYLNGNPDLADTIKRLQAYQAAGADVLYAPGLTKRDDITALVRALDRPVNVLAGLKGVAFTLTDFVAMGVRRVSIGSGLTRAALGAFLRAAREMRDHGTFSFADDAVSFQEISAMFE